MADITGTQFRKLSLLLAYSPVYALFIAIAICTVWTAIYSTWIGRELCWALLFAWLIALRAFHKCLMTLRRVNG